MQLKVPCPTCGKRLRLGEHESGKRALCPACGGAVEVPPAPLLGPLRPETPTGSTPLAELDIGDSEPSLIVLEVIPSPEAALALGSDAAAAAAAASVPEPAAAPPRQVHAVRRRRKRGAKDDDAASDRVPLIHIHPAYGLAAAAVAVVLVSVATLAALGRFESWEERHRADMTALKGQAETAANEGRLDDA